MLMNPKSSVWMCGTVRDPVDGLPGSSQAAQDVVAVDVDDHTDHKQQETFIINEQEERFCR